MYSKACSTAISILLLVAFLIVVTTREAHAYVDLGSGSFLLQMLLATVFGSFFVIKVFWRRLTAQVHRLFLRLRITTGKHT